MSKQATISADIIAYTALSNEERQRLEEKIISLLKQLGENNLIHGFFGRLIKGDYIECGLKHPKYVFRIALLLKTLVKSFQPENRNNKRVEKFEKYGIRMAVAVAPLSRFDVKNKAMDGEAIYLTGRAMKNASSTDKKKIKIKDTMQFLSSDKELQDQFDVIFYIIDTMINNCTAKQSEILFYKLLDYSEKEIVDKTGKYQSTINQHSNAGGWPAINKALMYFEQVYA